MLFFSLYLLLRLPFLLPLRLDPLLSGLIAFVVWVLIGSGCCCGCSFVMVCVLVLVSFKFYGLFQMEASALGGSLASLQSSPSFCCATCWPLGLALVTFYPLYIAVSVAIA